MKTNYIIIPTFNDWKSLNKLIGVLSNSLKIPNVKFFLIIIDDCSTDKIYLEKTRYKNIKRIEVISLKENVGSQKAIFLGLKHLRRKIKSFSSNDTVSILDSDGEDNPAKLKKLIKYALKKKNYFVFANRAKRNENLFLRFLNQIRLIITFFLTGKYINFGNFSCFHINNLKKILKNDDLSHAYSSGVLKNHKKIILVDVKKNKRYFGKSKVNLIFLIHHSIKIISVFYKEVFFRTLSILILLLILIKGLKLNLIFIGIFFILNLIFSTYNMLDKSKKIKSEFVVL